MPKSSPDYPGILGAAKKISEREVEKRERFVEHYGVGKEGVQRLAAPAPTAFDIWWGAYWKNRTDTIEHTVARGIARDAWDQGRRSRG